MDTSRLIGMRVVNVNTHADLRLILQKFCSVRGNKR